jgi:hypothetical protein
MFAKTAVVLAATAILAEQALALNPHRHVHNKLHKKDIIYVATDVVIVTDWVTVTVVDGEGPTADSKVSTNFLAAGRPQRTESYAKLVESTSSTSSTSSTPTSTSVAVVETPAPAPTTLVTQPKPETVVPTPAAAPPPPPAAESPVVQVVQPAPQPAAPAPAPAAAGPVHGAKRGLAYNEANLVNNFAPCSKCVWAYNWDSADNGLSRGDLNYVPMLWGTNSVHTSRWNKNADNMLSKGSTHLLSFNEPDFPSQSNLSPKDAAAGHVKYMNPYAGKAKIGAPAITNSNIPGQGLDWLRAFIAECDARGCAIDFCVTHWYSPPSLTETLFDHLQKVHEICHGKNVWLTEFAPLGSDGEKTSFLQTNLPRLDGVPYLERYSYFMVSSGNLVLGNSLSSFGNVYVSA